ncbi:MAG: four-carbon acid sugar kinase family protein, partial [Candidatus Eremiobacteraeota bacterium]|nr:four-carbon acid sugar kinase family protein [Candidatus Eremiobacteraeota bacterium]
MTDLALCFYGDDFTGSTDALENLSAAGLRTLVLFALPPEAELKRLAGLYDALGVAGIARSLPTAEIEAEIRPVFEAFARLRPAVVQYKICSTFDSSPSRGSIGRACEIGHAAFGACAIPVVAAQPRLGRYTVFGNHFARAGDGAVYRLDRHPAMAHHPATPMTEADLVVHLQAQTMLPVSGPNRLELDDYAVVAPRHAGPLVLD